MMDRREFRIEAIKFLYLLEVGGTYDKDEIDSDIYNEISNLLEYTDDIEDILNKALTDWKLDRLNIVDKAILKYAVYEMKYKKLPAPIAINEAIEITKEYSDIDGKQKSFNNRVLDKVKDLI